MKRSFFSHGLLTNQPSSLTFQMSLVFFLWSCLQTEAYRGKKQLIHSLKMAISSPGKKKKKVKGQATHSLLKLFRFPRLAGRLPVSWLSSKILQLKCHQILTQLHKTYFFITYSSSRVPISPISLGIEPFSLFPKRELHGTGRHITNLSIIWRSWATKNAKGNPIRSNIWLTVWQEEHWQGYWVAGH